MTLIGSYIDFLLSIQPRVESSDVVTTQLYLISVNKSFYIKSKPVEKTVFTNAAPKALTPYIICI